MKLPSPRRTRPTHKMLRDPHHLRRTLSLAFGALAILLVPAATHAQTLPPTQPTSQPSQAAVTSPPTSQPVTPPVSTPHHAQVTYAGGQLQVRADNSSLNQILRSISHQTGLKITGGVEEQRVFGNYGPGPISAVLATLLDGTNTNIFLVGGNTTNPPELVLTQRSGGASPPEPNSPAYAMYDDSVDHDNPVAPPAAHNTAVLTPAQPSAPVAAPSALQPTTPGAIQPVAPGVLPAIPHADASAPHPVATSPAAPRATVSAATPNSRTPLTPEAVMQQLLKMQQQQAQQKKDLDDKVQKEQIDQQQRLKKPNHQNPSSQPQNPPSQAKNLSGQSTTPTTPQ